MWLLIEDSEDWLCFSSIFELFEFANRNKSECFTIKYVKFGKVDEEDEA